MKTIRQYQTRIPEKQIRTRLLFRILLCAAILLFILLSGENTTQAQVRATGHVFAEIVEPTALSARANNSHFIETAENTPVSELVIARVKLSGRANVNIDVAVQTSQLEAANGQILLFDAFTCAECTEENLYTLAGDKMFTLKATPEESLLKKKSNTYKGSYSVVFMYN